MSSICARCGTHGDCDCEGRPTSEIETGERAAREPQANGLINVLDRMLCAYVAAIRQPKCAWCGASFVYPDYEAWKERIRDSDQRGIVCERCAANAARRAEEWRLSWEERKASKRSTDAKWRFWE